MIVVFSSQPSWKVIFQNVQFNDVDDHDVGHLGVEGYGALVDVLPVVALSCLHVDHLPIINSENDDVDYDN